MQRDQEHHRLKEKQSDAKLQWKVDGMKEFWRKKIKVDEDNIKTNELSNWKMKLKMEFNQILNPVALTVQKVT